VKHVLECTGYEMLVRDIERAEGYYLFDSKGRRYMDFEAGVWSMSIGHSNPQINEVVRNQIDRVMHLGFRYTNELIERAAEDVISTLAPFSGKCLFLSSGSEAVEFSVKAAKAIIKEKKMFTFKQTYLSAYGMSGSKKKGEWMEFELAPCMKCPNSYNCKSCRLIDEIPFHEIGAFIFEPGNSGGLVLIPPKNLVEEVAKRIKEADGIIVVDEVTTGAGRTGKWYGFQHFNIQPDIVALGKGIGNGYPVSVVAVEEKTAEIIEAQGLRHSQSHQNDALGAAIVSAVIHFIQENDLINKSKENGQYFLEELCRLKEKSSDIREVRGAGMMLAVEFEKGEAAVLESLNEYLIEKGFIVGYKPAFKLLRFYPSLTTTREDIDSLLECMSNALV
jgi:acetylornithine/N-succinyldiaminopimelate aminotransferase